MHARGLMLVGILAGAAASGTLVRAGHGDDQQGIGQGDVFTTGG